MIEFECIQLINIIISAFQAPAPFSVFCRPKWFYNLETPVFLKSLTDLILPFVFFTQVIISMIQTFIFQMFLSSLVRSR